jgi:inner membrane protein
MPTVISHAVVGAALITPFSKQAIPRRLMILGAVCSMAPDTDLIGFRFGIHYGDLLGHRGLTHSVAFAAFLASIALLAARSKLASPARLSLIWIYLFLATASHGLLDAMTNGGLGVAFFHRSSQPDTFFLLLRSQCLRLVRASFPAAGFRSS